MLAALVRMLMRQLHVMTPHSVPACKKYNSTKCFFKYVHCDSLSRPVFATPSAKISRAEGKLIHCLQMVYSIKFCAVRPLCALHSDSKQTERDVMTLIQDIRICQICFIFCLLSIFCKHKNISHISESEIALNPRKDLQSNFLKLLGSLLKAQAYHFLI